MLLSTLFIVSILGGTQIITSLSSLITDHQAIETITSIPNHEPVLSDNTQLPDSTDKSEKKPKRLKVKLAITSGVLTFGGIVFANRKRIASLFDGKNTSMTMTTETVQNPGKILPVYESWLFGFIIFSVLLVLICVVTFFWPKDAGDEELAEYEGIWPTSPDDVERSKSNSSSDKILLKAHQQNQNNTLKQETTRQPTPSSPTSFVSQKEPPHQLP